MFKSRVLRKVLTLLLACLVISLPAGLAVGRSPMILPASHVMPLVAPDFTITTSPDSTTLAVSATGSSSISLASQGGFYGNITLSASSYLLDVSLNKTSVSLASGGTANATLTILAPSGTPPNNYTVTVEGSNGCNLSHITYIAVRVTGPDFTISSVKTLLTAAPGGSNSSEIDLASKNGFSGSVALFSSSTLTTTVSPPSVSLTPSGTGTSILMVSVSTMAQPGNYTIEVFGSLGSLFHSVEVDVTVTGPGFVLSSTPYSFTVVAGGASNSSTISVLPFGGFTGTVSLTNSSVPLSTTLSPTTVVIPGMSTSTLTVTAPAGTTPDLYSVTVTGNTSSLIQSVDIFVTVKGPDFDISADPTSLMVAVGGSSCISTITVTGIGGFPGTVALAATSFPSGLTVSLSPTSILASGPSTLTVSAPGGTVPGSYGVEIEAGSSSWSHFAIVSVLVTGPDFTLSASPTSLTITAPATSPSTVTLSSLNGFSSAVTLTTMTSGFGLNPTISPSSVSGSGSATLTVGVNSSAVSGTYYVLVTGTSGSLSHTMFVPVTVIAPDFSISASPSPVTISSDSPGTSTITITALEGFTGLVSLSVFPSSNLNASIQPNAITGSGTATLSLNSTIPGSYTVEVDGSSGALFHSLIVPVTVVGPDFTISAGSVSPSQILAGSSGTSSITLAPVLGFTGTVTVSVSSSVPAGLTCASLSSVTFGSSSQTETLSCNASTAGDYAVIVTGMSGALSHNTATILFHVTDYAVVPSSPVTVTGSPSSMITQTISLTALNGFTGTVSLSVSASTPSGLTCTLSSSVTFGASLQTATLSCSSRGTNDFVVTVTGASGTLSHTTANITFHVALIPDFTISAGAVSPSQILAGASGTSTITLTAVNSFTGTVNLSVSASTPSWLTCAPPAGAIFGSSPQTVALSCSAMAAGDYAVAVTGMSGTLSRTTAMIFFHVTDFTLSSNPASLTIQAGGSGSTTITVTPTNGFTGAVSLTATVSPSGPTAVLGIAMVTGGSGSSTLTVSVESGVAAATYTVTIHGGSGSLSHSGQVSVTVTSPSTSGAATILGLAPTTFYELVGAVILGLAAGGLYFVRVRRKTTK